MNKGIDVTAECSFTYGAQKKHVFKGKSKSIVCKSVKDNAPCAYGSKCIFAHYADEVQPNQCNSGFDCALVKCKSGNFKNKNMKKVCPFIHPDETVTDWLSRNGFDESLMHRPVQDQSAFKCTRMCISVMENIPCTKVEECTYAHCPEELQTTSCNFAAECKHVRKEVDEYFNNDTGKICVFLHPGESLRNFETRALRPLAEAKKLKSIETKVDTPIAVKIESPIETKVETPIETNVKAPIEVKVDEIPITKVETTFPVENDRIILNVPHHMALEMLQILLKNGKTNIELNIY